MKSSENRILFITFGDGSDDIKLAVKRLVGQANSTQVFSSVVGLNHEELKKMSPEYFRFSTVLNDLADYPKYFRIGKCFIIYAALTGAFGDFDQLVYADAGCELITNRLARLRLLRALQRAQKKPIGLAKTVPVQEECYSKREMLDYLNADFAMRKSSQVQSGVIILNVCEEARYFVKSWIKLSDPELELWQDPKVIEPPLIQHRHDQSIFSILWKIGHYNTEDFYWNNPRKRGLFLDIISSSYSIHAIRNRTGQSQISATISSNVLLVYFGFILFHPISLLYRLVNRLKIVRQRF